MPTVEVDGDTLTVDGTRVRFRHPIDETVVAGDVVVVLLDVPLGTIDNRNVVGVGADGERRWQIEPISDDPTADQPYVNLIERDDGVWVFNPIGAECRIDPETGEFVENRMKKW